MNLVMLCAFCVAVCFVRSARAEATRVALVRRADAEALLAEATTRLRAELTAAGFDVVELDAKEGVDPRVQVEAARLDPPPAATLALLRIGEGPAAEIWIADRLTKKTVVRRIDVGDGVKRAPSVLAVRAVELLRASLVEAAFPTEASGDARSASTNADARAVPDDVSRFIAPPLKSAADATAKKNDATAKPAEQSAPEHAEKREPDEVTAPEPARSGEGRSSDADHPRGAIVAASLGAAVLFRFRGLAPAYAPVLRLSYTGPILGARVTVVAPAFGAGASATTGDVAIRQELALAEVTGQWPARGPWALIASAGAGAYHWHVAGSATPPNVARTEDRAGALFGAGLGGLLRFSDRLGVFVDGQALLFAPNLVVAIGDDRPGGTGRPTVALTASFWGAFP